MLCSSKHPNSCNLIHQFSILISVNEPSFQTRHRCALCSSRLLFEREAQPQLPKAEPASEEAKIVDQIWQQAERAKKGNPAWWAAESRRISARLLLWLDEAQMETPPQAMPQLLKRLGTSYYALAMFDKWEAVQRRRGLTPARDTEKALRWDRKLQDETGKGRQLITEYLLSKEAKT